MSTLVCAVDCTTDVFPVHFMITLSADTAKALYGYKEHYDNLCSHVPDVLSVLVNFSAGLWVDIHDLELEDDYWYELSNAAVPMTFCEVYNTALLIYDDGVVFRGYFKHDPASFETNLLPWATIIKPIADGKPPQITQVSILDGKSHVVENTNAEASEISETSETSETAEDTEDTNNSEET